VLVIEKATTNGMVISYLIGVYLPKNLLNLIFWLQSKMYCMDYFDSYKIKIQVVPLLIYLVMSLEKALENKQW
jgi:hypothetical protein